MSSLQDEDISGNLVCISFVSFGATLGCPVCSLARFLMEASTDQNSEHMGDGQNLPTYLLQRHCVNDNRDWRARESSLGFNAGAAMPVWACRSL